MKFDPYMYRYPSRRNLVFGKNGVVASASPLASQAGLDILKKVEMRLTQLWQQRQL
ncbi:hypothetical protein GCM10025857_41870 [Alicyclobacillus contaminans]|uniref:Uncharacterized protein n=1 Tax=Tetragenococcus osmophilus TaxID=526944 RepID=A0AA37XMR2_9ENTE|nr:hypothetical protein [Tetragenococcus osmophilus]GMA52830.1 hypothetical protein GCM10025857_41870 [Alicyclobacillus contaminans]GMA73173.1 hypothetical protein GCM10025885_22220 [Tetragenococcus osmophilus]